ncbi:MAG: DUF6364 family protein [Treponema sp.]|nr:DUF6364 family protein [Treponema sp.]
MITYTIQNNSKLTLSLGQDAISQAKEYAAKMGKSLSALTEDFYKSLGVTEQSPIEEKFFSPIVAEIAGIIPAESLGDGNSYKEDYINYLETKYGN